MFKDTEEELRRLEQELLEPEEEPDCREDCGDYDDDYDGEDDGLWQDDEEPEYFVEEDDLSRDVRAFMQGREVNAYNADRTDPEQMSRQVLEPEKPRSNRGLVWFAVLLLLAIAAVLGYWAVKINGLL